MLRTVLRVLAERYSTRGYLASGKITWSGLSERAGDGVVEPHVRRLVVMGAVLADRAGVSLTVPMRLEVLDAPVLRHWGHRVDAVGRDDFRTAAAHLARAELVNVLDWTANRGRSLDEAGLQCAAGCAGALAVSELVHAPTAFTAVLWHPGTALDKLDWLMRLRPGAFRDAAALQTGLYRNVVNRTGTPAVPLPLAMLRPGPAVPVPRRREDVHRPSMRVVTISRREPAQREPGRREPVRRDPGRHRCGALCTDPSHANP